VIQLQITDLRIHGIRADHERERVGALNPRINLLQPLRGERDILPVDPRASLALFERFVESAYENLVLVRVGDENVGHDVLPTALIYWGFELLFYELLFF
jgi:hypothetical protein